MERIHRMFALLATLALLLPLLAACGGETPATTAPAAATNTTAPAPAAAATDTPASAAAAPTNTTAPAAGNAGGEKVTLTMATWAGADESKELQAIIDKVNAAATDYQIVYNPAPAD
ncbi:MAG TPA: hypothetical protein VF276_19570, partial [Chloroflexia bacterium]